MLQEGLARPPQSPQDRLRHLIEDTLRRPLADDALLYKMTRGGRIAHRLDEHDSGRTLYATADISKATEFALYMSPHGGELAGDVHAALATLGHREDPRFQGARPVLLVIDTPETSILDQGGTRVALGEGLSTLEGYEQYIVDSKQSRIVSVTFGARQGEQPWSFDGQPALLPQQALEEIAPQFRGRQHFRGDPEKTAILEEIFTAQDIPGAEIQSRTSGVVTRLRFTNAEGYKDYVLVPDPDFAAAMPRLAENGFTGHGAQYKLPHGLVPREMDAYLNVLMVKDMRGDITPDDYMARLQAMADKMRADNPALATLKFSPENPAELQTMIRGVIHGFKTQDIQHQLSPPAPGSRQDSIAAYGGGALADFRVSPQTKDALERQLEIKTREKSAALQSKAAPSA